MRRLLSPTVLGIAALAAVGAGRDAKAQGARQGLVSSTPSPITNPYLSPYANPFLNPALTLGSTNREDALLYLWAAQQQPGGLLGPRIDPSRSGKPRAAEMPRSATIAGRSTARYFQRGVPGTAGGTGRRYQSYGRYFGNNGR